MKSLLTVMEHFNFNTYLHCHVMEILRRQLDRDLPAVTKCVFEKTEILNLMVKGVALVRNEKGVLCRVVCLSAVSTIIWLCTCVIR